MTSTFFTESVSAAPIKGANGRWLVAVATPGQGSSAFYSEDMIRETGPAAFPQGAKAFINHESSRNPKDMIGIYPDGAFWDETRKQLMAELEVFTHWQTFVEEVGPHCGISIHMAGEADEEGNATRFLENRQNGADLVSYPGLVGSGLVEMLESAREAGSKPPVALAEDHDGKDATRMDEAKLAKLIELLEAMVATKTAEAQATAQVEADTAAVSEAITAFESAVEAIDTADLTPAQKKSLRAKAKDGSDVTALIEEAVSLKAEILQESAADNDPATGRVVTANGPTFTTPWSK